MAGRNKARLDPFSPEKPEDVVFVKDLMEQLHGRFIDWVRARRGSRLRADDEALFDGGFMLGEQALARGLIDGFETIDELVRQLGGDRAQSRRFAPKRQRLWARLPRFGLDVLLDALEERAWRINLR
jgi:ClpP class serine protease